MSTANLKQYEQVTTEITPDQVVKFLEKNPHFLSQHADLLANVEFRHPDGGHLISITERQLITLREKKKLLESKLKELIQYGEENDAINEKIHHFTLTLLSTRDINALLPAIKTNLKEDFNIDDVALTFWGNAISEHHHMPYDVQTQMVLASYAHRLRLPYCGKHPGFNPHLLFNPALGLSSFACIPLMNEVPCGLLVLASQNKDHFYEQMGTLYLIRLGELITETWLSFI